MVRHKPTTGGGDKTPKSPQQPVARPQRPQPAQPPREPVQRPVSSPAPVVRQPRPRPVAPQRETPQLAFRPVPPEQVDPAFLEVDHSLSQDEAASAGVSLEEVAPEASKGKTKKPRRGKKAAASESVEGSNAGEGESESAESGDAPPKKKSKAPKIIGGVLAGVLLLGGGGFAYKYYIDPPLEEYLVEKSSAFSLAQWNSIIQSGQLQGVITTDEGSYLLREFAYSNGNELQDNFILKALSTVTYEIPQFTRQTIWGKDAVDSNGNPLVTYANYDPSEPVEVTHLDYSKITFTDAEIKAAKELMEYDEASVTMPEQNKNLLLQLLNTRLVSSEATDVPLTVTERSVAMEQVEGGWRVLPEEDIFLDELLFSSEEFQEMEARLSESLAGDAVSPVWEAWNALTDEEKESVDEPQKLPESARIVTGWIGAYNLLVNEAEAGGTPIVPRLGSGTREDAASVETPIQTVVLSEVEGQLVQTPISVNLKSFLVGQDAIDFFESKDIRNRGLTTESRTKLFTFQFEVTNLSDAEVTIVDNSSFADYNANTTGRTGTLYGLQDKVTLAPGATGIIESWGGSVEPSRAFLIWGKDFQRRAEPVWFRVLGAAEGSVAAPVAPTPEPSATPNTDPSATPSTGSGTTEEEVPLDDLGGDEGTGDGVEAPTGDGSDGVLG